MTYWSAKFIPIDLDLGNKNEETAAKYIAGQSALQPGGLYQMKCITA